MSEYENVAKNVLRGFGLEIVAIDNDTFGIKRGGEIFSISKADIDHYLQVKPRIKKDSETILWLPGYYEHVVQFEGARLRRPFREDAPFVLNSHDAIQIEVGRPSPLFCLSLADTDTMDRELRRLMASFIMRSPQARSISDMFRMHTIRVISNPESTVGKNQKRAHDLAEAAIFHFAYGRATPISFTKSWIRTNYWLGRRDAETVQFPLKTYNSELVGYYNLALSSDSLVLGFLALYKILEYFFTSVAEEALHSKIKEKITAPDFSHTKPKKLRELIAAIRSFESRLDELSSLKLVLQNNFDKADLRSWVETYESENGTYFTKETEIFSEKFKIDISDNAIIQNMASRIYTIRNAIIHNKEGEVSRYVPFTGQEEGLHKEVQLLMYLSEQMIIKTGRDLMI